MADSTHSSQTPNQPLIPDSRIPPSQLLEAELVDPSATTPRPPSMVVQPQPLATEVVDATLVPLRREGLLHGLDRLIVRSWRATGSACEWLFGLFSLVVGLAIIATIPIVQVLSLGYLLEATGRIARSGRFRDGFVGIRKAARVGSLVLGTWLWLLPLRLVSNLWRASHLIDPSSPRAAQLQVLLYVLTVLILSHILWAWFRGGRLRHFLWPAPVRFVRRVIRGGKYAEARDRAWDFVMSLRLPYFFWLGLRGFAGTVFWLALPITLYIAGTALPEAADGVRALLVLCGMLGAAMLSIVLLYLPFLQAEFAARGELVAIFDLGAVRRKFRKAPIAFWFSLFVTLLFSLPLYLFKIEWTYEEVTILPALVFVSFMLPAHLVTGWAMARAVRRERPRHFIFRWGARLSCIPVVTSYVFLIFFVRYTSWYGHWSLFEQPAFLLPVPFMG